MHDQSTQREALHDPAEAERHTDNTILSLMLDDTSSWPWSVEEIARELANPIKTRDAIRRLTEAGLVHRLGDFVFPTRTARRAAEIEIGT
jgi:HD-like signal output (HDOD) protein